MARDPENQKYMWDNVYPYLYHNLEQLINDLKDYDLCISADVDFNYGQKKLGKYSLYKKILVDNMCDTTSLEKCNKKYRSVCNFSVFIQTGGMNIAKNWDGDRLDAYIYRMKHMLDFIKNKDIETEVVSDWKKVPDELMLLKSYVGKGSREEKEKKKINVLRFLQDKYASKDNAINLFCRDFYCIDDDGEELIESMSNSEESIMPITSFELLERYIKLTNDCWDYRIEKLISQQINIDEVNKWISEQY